MTRQCAWTQDRPSPAVQEGTSRRNQTTKINHRGFEYPRAWCSSRKIVFRCSVYRSTGCKTRLAIRPTVSGYELVNTHTCIKPMSTDTSIFDYTTAMKIWVDEFSIQDLTKSVHEVWQQASAEFYPDDDVIRKGLSEEQVKSRVYRVRQKHYGSFLLGRVEVPPPSMVEGKPLTFFQFHQSKPRSDPTAKPDRIIGWAHPILRQLLLYNGVSLFLDGTFRCVPTEFKQCMDLMVHDKASDLFVPVYFVLCTSKAKDMYLDTQELIHRDTAEKLNPPDVVCDFELSLINAVEKLFPNAEVIGCLFHFKQAVRRRMKVIYHIPEAEIQIAMQKGVLDVLTVIEPEKVSGPGIRWVKRTIRARCTEAGVAYTRAKWKQLWGYFRRTWIDRYNVESWNVHGLTNTLVARTNNPLERFNRELNQAFPSPHSNIATFVRVIRSISQDNVAKLANVARGRRRRGNRVNSKSRKGARSTVQEHIELPELVEFSEGDTGDDSESEQKLEVSAVSSTDGDNDSDGSGCSGPDDEPSSEAEVIPDFSFESSECGDLDVVEAATL